MSVNVQMACFQDSRGEPSLPLWNLTFLPLNTNGHLCESRSNCQIGCAFSRILTRNVKPRKNVEVLTCDVISCPAWLQGSTTSLFVSSSSLKNFASVHALRTLERSRPRHGMQDG